MQNLNIKSNQNNVLILVVILIYVLILFSSCEKKEPVNSPVPEEIVNKVIKDLKLSDDFSGTIYNSGIKEQNLSEKEAKELYVKKSKNNNQEIELLKIEKYFIKLSSDDSSNEIGIFKLYRNSSSGYVKNMVKNRILAVQNKFADFKSDAVENYNPVTIANSGEARSYGNYVYYVMHPEKDRIFEKIENIFKGEDNIDK